MKVYIDKIILIIFSLFFSFTKYPNLNPAIYLLICLSMSTSLDLIKNRIFKSLIYLIFLGLIIYDNNFLIFVPLLIYNLAVDNKIIVFIFSAIIILRKKYFIFFLCLTSIYLSLSEKTRQDFEIRNKSIRDELREDTISLEKYNEQLIIDREKDVEIAILEERNRISRELHDSVGHLVSSSILQVEAISFMTEDKKVLNSLNDLQNRLTSGMKGIRKSIHDLHNKSLDLEEQIYSYADQYPNLDLSLNLDIKSDFDYRIKFDILSIVKESMTNTIKHSNADKFNVNIREQTNLISLSIKDNGNKLPNNTNDGIGLISMNEIAAKYNGFMNYHFKDGFNIHIVLMKGNENENNNN